MISYRRTRYNLIFGLSNAFVCLNLNQYLVFSGDAEQLRFLFVTFLTKFKELIMTLGAFSNSLSVKDLQKSKDFYEQLVERNYLIMKNGNALIGLFQGMFENNMMTFNPGWDENATKLDDFDDVRKIQNQLKSAGVSLISEADANSEGPASLMLTDPDGNMILIDQHV